MASTGYDRGMNDARKPKIAQLVTAHWAIDEPADTGVFEQLMRGAIASGLVREWDDGRGRAPWYSARRGPEERALRVKCVAALGHEPQGRVRAG